MALLDVIRETDGRSYSWGRQEHLLQLSFQEYQKGVMMKLWKNERTMLFFIGVLFLLSLTASAFGAVGDITISSPGCIDTGDSFISEVEVNVGNTVLGAYSVTLTFDKDVLEITAVQGGTTSEFSAVPVYSSISTANDTGQINVGYFNAAVDSPKDLVSILRVTFRGIGLIGASSTLSMTVKDLADPNFNPIAHQVINSTVTVATIPTVTTTAISNEGTTSASSGGNVTSDGCATVTARGVCWSAAVNPTIADNKTSDGTGIGPFASSINGLNSGSTYYLRAYATNGNGTAYGSNAKIETLSPTSECPDCSGGVVSGEVVFKTGTVCECGTKGVDLIVGPGVTIESDAKVTFIGSRVTLKSGVHAKSGAEVAVTQE